VPTRSTVLVFLGCVLYRACILHEELEHAVSCVDAGREAGFVNPATGDTESTGEAKINTAAGWLQWISVVQLYRRSAKREREEVRKEESEIGRPLFTVQKHILKQYKAPKRGQRSEVL
jgi:hypothetical protein